MCGIIGGIHVQLSSLEKGLRLMHHRGPDDFGLARINDNLAFGHKRLSILDLSRNGHQPMQTVGGRVTVTFNGEIYNYLTLKSELSLHYSFQSSSDTEVLLFGYLRWGIEGLLQRIQGMFAFGLHDAETDTLFLCRDRFGKKPLYYYSEHGRFVFSSTLPSLLAGLEHTPELDPIAIDDYLTYMCVPGERTMFQSIRKLPPACCMRVHAGSSEMKRYWDLSFAEKSSLSESEILDELDNKVRAAVQRRMIIDVPLGAFLSGGVDSSLVVGVMASLSEAPIRTVTMGFADERFDEREYARMVSKRWTTQHYEEVIQPEASAVLPELIFHTGEPLADSSMLPTYYVSKLARRYLTVILNGDGGDELFAGYARPMVEQMAKRYRSIIPKPLRSGMASIYTHGRKSRFRPLSALQQLMEAGALSPRDTFIFNRAVRSNRQDLYSDAFLSQLQDYHPDRVYQQVWDRSDAADSVDKMLYGDLMTYLPDELLVKMDTMTMANSLEARSPLLDTELAEFAATIPSTLKTKNFQTKYLLKKLAARYVPQEVLYRPKKGFNMPMSQWMRGELGQLASDLLLSERASSRGLFKPAVIRRWLDEHRNGKADHGQKLWSLLILELWFLMFLDNELKPSDSISLIDHQHMIMI